MNLTRSIVLKEDRSVVRSRRDVPMETRWAIVTLNARIEENSDQSLNFTVRLFDFFDKGNKF